MNITCKANAQSEGTKLNDLSSESLMDLVVEEYEKLCSLNPECDEDDPEYDICTEIIEALFVYIDILKKRNISLPQRIIDIDKSLSEYE